MALISVQKSQSAIEPNKQWKVYIDSLRFPGISLSQSALFFYDETRRKLLLVAL